MPWNLFSDNNGKATTTTQLAKEISKLAKLGNVQNGLPGAMRGFPVAAIVAGKVYAKMVSKDGENVVEKAVLRDREKDESVVGLQAPGSRTMGHGTIGEGERGDGRDRARQEDGGVDVMAKLKGQGEGREQARQDGGLDVTAQSKI
jgi:hypothetical protein